VTHPFHPLAGDEFDFVYRRRNWDGDWVYFYDRAGALCWVPSDWTDVVAPHPAVALAGARSAFLVEDLLTLAALIRDRMGGTAV